MSQEESRHTSKNPDCKGCKCTLCYKQEFCDHCNNCKHGSHKKTECDRYEDAYEY